MCFVFKINLDFKRAHQHNMEHPQEEQLIVHYYISLKKHFRSFH